jgi:hypothetical protein
LWLLVVVAAAQVATAYLAAVAAALAAIDHRCKVNKVVVLQLQNCV